MKTLIQAIIENPKQTSSQLIISGKIFHRRFNRLPFIIKFGLISSLFISIFLYGSVLMLFFYNSLKSNSFLELNQCPACFGTKLCEELKDGNFQLYGWSKLTFFDFFNDQEEYSIVKNNGDFLMARRLASSKQRSQLDESICLKVASHPSCDLNTKAIYFYPLSGDDWVLKQMKGLSIMTTCPTQRLAMNIMDRFAEKMDAIQLSASERFMMMYTLQLNQEPILFQTFPQKENYPFPQYIGACGRIVTYQNPGHPLSLYIDSTWEIRARLALQVIDIAYKLTMNKLQYGIYFTAIGLSTFSVNPLDGEVLISDGRFFIVVDLYQIQLDKFQDWDNSCVSKYEEKCEHHIKSEDACVVNSPSNICRCHVADVNYYAVCRYLLSPIEGNGLLSKIPAHIDQLYDLTQSLKYCSNPLNRETRLDIMNRISGNLKEQLGMTAFTKKTVFVKAPPQQNIF